MMKFLTNAARLLLGAADGRALDVLRKQAELSKPFHVEFRAYAGSCN